MQIPLCDLSLVVFSEKNQVDWDVFLPSLTKVLEPLNIQYEIIILNNGVDSTSDRFNELNKYILMPSEGAAYGSQLQKAVKKSRGEYIITMEAEPLTPVIILYDLWNARASGDIVIGSRYVAGSSTELPLFRGILSRLINVVFSRGLDLQVLDMSSAYRLYRSRVIKNISTVCTDFDVLQEILVLALMMGYQITEIPFTYRSKNLAYGRAARFALAYMKTFARLWKLRNSIASADYDARAYNAMMPPQRYWQRQRYRIITSLINKNGRQKCLDVGCGSSRIIGALPHDSVALDILMRKLRYSRRFGSSMVQGSIFVLPVPNESFPCVLCSQVIEHVPRENVLDELDRVLQPGGLLILGTPDYANWQWGVIEWLYKKILPQAYADEHITHYTYQELIQSFVSERGYNMEAANYILKGEMILSLRKPRL